MNEPSNEKSKALAPRRFLTTRWSVIRDAVEGEPEAARAALDELCRVYWQPVFAFIQRNGVGEHEAQELTQDFFAGLLENRLLSRADANKGRFRSYLFGAVTRFLGHYRERLQTMKRGGHMKTISWNIEEGEPSYLSVASKQPTAEEFFNRQWALAVLADAWSYVREQYVHDGKAVLFDALKPYIVGHDAPATFETLAKSIQMSEAATKMAVVRLRKRFRDALIQSVRRITESDSDIEDELRELFVAVRG